MAYIGRQLARGENRLFDDISSSFNGSTTTFNLTISSVATSTATPYQLFVSLGGVMQKPSVDFTTAGNQITFTTAPAGGLSCWIMMQGDATDSATVSDGAITPSKISGSGDFAFPADVRLKDSDGSHYVGFQAPATVGTNKVWTLPAADGSASTFLQTNGSGVLTWSAVGGASGIDFNDNVKARFGTGNDLEIFHNSSNSVINDAGTGDLLLQVGGTTQATISSTGVVIANNLTVSGTTTTINTQTLDVEDKNVVIGKVSSPSDTTADGGGWTLKGATDKTFNWVNATDAWTSSEHIHLLDNKKLFVGGASGTTDGLEIVHNGSNSILNDSGTGTLQLQLGGSTKLEIQTGGINVTGAINVNGAALSTAPEIEATASGAISANDAVIINSDGTVSKPATIASAFGSKQEFTANEPNWVDCCYEPVNNKVVVVYTDSNDSNRIKAIAGTVDGSNKTVTWGTTINLHTNTSYACKYPRITATNDDGWCVAVWWSSYDSNRLKGNSIQTSSSDNSLTLQSNNQTYGLVINELANAYTTTKTYAFDIAWNTGSGGRAGGMVVQTDTGYTVKAKAVKISSDGTLQRPGNQLNLWTGMQRKNVGIAFNSDNNNYLVVAGEYQGDGGGGIDDWGTVDARVIYSNTSDNVTVNTAGISVNDGQVGDPGIFDVSYAPIYKKFLVGYRWENNANNGKVYGLLVDTNSVTTDGGTTQTIARGTSILVDDIIKNQSNFMMGGDISFDEDKDCWILTWRGEAAPNAYTGAIGIVKYDGTSLSKVTAAVFDSGNCRYFSNTYDPDTKTSIIAYQDGTQDGQVIVMVPSYDTLKTRNFMGFAQAGYSNGATAKISIVGNQSTHSSLTPASIYYVQKDGTISTTADSPSVEAGIALSTTKLLIKG